MSEWHARRANAAANEDVICQSYRSGLSVAQTASRHGVSVRTVRNILTRKGCPVRSRAEGNALRWSEEAFRANQVEKRRGKPASNRGTTWKLSRPVSKPKLRGERNPAWKGGRLSLQLSIRRSGAYQFWRRSVFERDDYTCVNCHKRGGVLDADHKHPFSKILDEYSIISLEEALECPALWAVDNGRTLCRSCHRKTPTFGMNGGARK